MPEVTHRVCTRCEVEKPVAELVPDKKYRGGYMPCCKPCRNNYVKDLIVEDPRRRRRNIEAVLRSKMLHAYGMVRADYDRMVEEQGDRCAICKSTDKGRSSRFRTWNIDHCHETDLIRGLLCHNCNIKLGHYEWFMKHVGKEKMDAYLSSRKYARFKVTKKNRLHKSALKHATKP